MHFAMHLPVSVGTPFSTSENPTGITDRDDTRAEQETNTTGERIYISFLLIPAIYHNIVSMDSRATFLTPHLFC